MTTHQYLHLTHQIAQLESRMRLDFRLMAVIVVLGAILTWCFVEASKS